MGLLGRKIHAGKRLQFDRSSPQSDLGFARKNIHRDIIAMHMQRKRSAGRKFGQPKNPFLAATLLPVQKLFILE
jgi:hypothetical protein